MGCFPHVRVLWHITRTEAPLSETRLTLEQNLMQAYTGYFDVSPVEDGTPLRAACAYHSRQSQYVLVKKAELWAAESHEYLYLFSLPRLDMQTLAQAIERTLELGLPQVHPHAQHMNTFLTAVILCDETDSDTLVQLKKTKRHKDYKLSLHGWMEFRIAAVDLSTGEVSTNRSGSSLAADLSSFAEHATQHFH